jgi:hypothetical protein
VWDWNPAVDERAAGESPSVVLPNPGMIAAPASISAEAPTGSTFAALGVSWAKVGSGYAGGYDAVHALVGLEERRRSRTRSVWCASDSSRRGCGWRISRS